MEVKKEVTWKCRGRTLFKQRRLNLKDSFDLHCTPSELRLYSTFLAVEQATQHDLSGKWWLDTLLHHGLPSTSTCTLQSYVFTYTKNFPIYSWNRTIFTASNSVERNNSTPWKNINNYEKRELFIYHKKIYFWFALVLAKAYCGHLLIWNCQDVLSLRYE